MKLRNSGQETTPLSPSHIPVLKLFLYFLSLYSIGGWWAGSVVTCQATTRVWVRIPSTTYTPGAEIMSVTPLLGSERGWGSSGEQTHKLIGQPASLIPWTLYSVRGPVSKNKVESNWGSNLTCVCMLTCTNASTQISQKRNHTDPLCSFCDWLISLSALPSKFIHVDVYAKLPSSQGWALPSFICTPFVVLLTHSSICGHPPSSLPLSPHLYPLHYAHGWLKPPESPSLHFRRLTRNFLSQLQHPGIGIDKSSWPFRDGSR